MLSNPKLRQQYDILGLDLDDDEVEQTGASEDGGAESQTSSQTIVQDIASAALTAVLQFGVRTGTYEENPFCVGCVACLVGTNKKDFVHYSLMLTCVHYSFSTE